MAVIKHPAQRVGVFIDTQNLYHSAKHLYKSRVNFQNVLQEAVGDRVLVRAIAYVISTEGGEESAFFDALTKIGIETKVKGLQVFSDGAKKADWDVGLAIDAVKLAPKLDTVILATGDGDFVPLIEQALSDAVAMGAQRALTGPASRADMKTIDAHLAAIPESERSTYVALANAAFELAEARRLASAP